MLLIIQSGVTIKEECRGKVWERIDIPANMDFLSSRALYNGTHRIFYTAAQTPNPVVPPAEGGMPYPATPYISYR